jgi:hypothetical protein
LVPTLPARTHCGMNDLLNKLLYCIRPRWLASPYLWQTLSFAMQELPHGFPLVQCGPFVSVAPLRQELINCLRELPVMPIACVLQSFIRCC